MEELHSIPPLVEELSLFQELDTHTCIQVVSHGNLLSSEASVFKSIESIQH